MDSFSPSAILHGVLVSVDGIGVLILGESGTGKSECALELVDAGHRLVADDVIEIQRSDATLVGRSPERFFGLLEIRGLGIFDVRRVFGESAVERHHEISFCVEFREPGIDQPPERIGAEAGVYDLLGARLPGFVLPQDGRRNMRLLVETAARLVRLGGTAAQAVSAAHDELVSPRANAGSI